MSMTEARKCCRWLSNNKGLSLPDRPGAGQGGARKQQKAVSDHGRVAIEQQMVARA